MQLIRISDYQGRKARKPAERQVDCVASEAVGCAMGGAEPELRAGPGRLLEWPVREALGRERLALHSDVLRRSHVMSLPRPGHSPHACYLDYLHELVHARLAETVHPLFSTPEFLPETDPELLDEAQPVFQAATDWFVEHELLRTCPDRKAPELSRHFRLALRQLQCGGSLDKALALELALVLAKGRYFLMRRLELNGPMDLLVQAFGRTPAHKPSIFTLRALVNRLLELHHHARADVETTAWGQVWALERLG